MADNKLASYSIEDLQKRKKTLNTLYYVIGALILLFVGYILYSIISGAEGDKVGRMAPPMAMLSIVLLVLRRNQTSIDTELKLREAADAEPTD